jgi:hypothetical protein
MAIIDVAKLVKNYTGDGIEVQALRGVDLKVERGEFTAIAAQPHRRARLSDERFSDRRRQEPQ